MTAPSTAYKDYILGTVEGGSNGLPDPNTRKDCYVAKFLQNTTPTSGDEWGDGYFNENDSLEVKKEKIKSIFKLDGLFAVATTNGIGFVGTVIENSENYKQHNPNRLHSLGNAHNNQKVIFLNDAGLNVKPECSLGTYVLNYCNLVMINAYFRSSFYNNTIVFGLAYRGNVGGWYYDSNQDLDGILPDTMAAKGIFNDVLVYYPPFNKNDVITFKGYIENSEGVIETSEYSFVLDGAIWQYDAILRSDPQSSVGETAINFWMMEEDYAALSTLTDTGASTGIYGYLNPLRRSNEVTPSGWYIGILEDKAIYVDNNGQFTHYVELAPQQMILSCAVDLYQDPESNPIHDGIMFILNMNAPYNIPITGYISETPEGQPQVGGFSFSSTLTQGSSIVLNYDNVGFEYTGSTYYLIVNTLDHPHIQKVGTGQFI